LIGGDFMNKDTHVYCTKCKHFVLAEDKIYGGFIGTCPNELDCNIWDCEDSKPYEERPLYEEM
jgi:hypothetical protein